MTVLPKSKMTVDDFMVWVSTHEGRWELLGGVPVEMSPELLIHCRVKYLAARAFDRAIERAGAPCEFLLDSVGVRIDAHSMYQPDVLVYCGQRLPDDAIEVANPVVVVEILSPSDAAKVLRDKLVGYFLVPSIMHYLIVDPDSRLVIHHAHGSDAIATHILSDGSSLRLDPPGIEMAVAEFFPVREQRA
jgi:Uma2 family endonuclease